MKRLRSRLLLTGIIVLLFFQAQLFSSHGYSFQTPQPVETVSGLDVLPSALQASDGTLWVVWESLRSGPPNIFAKTYNGAVWSASYNITTAVANRQNIQPSISQLQNGTIVLVWASDTTGIFQIYYRTYTSGVWTSSVQLTSGAYNDYLPATAVSPAGTLWLVWVRQTANTSCTQGLCRQVFYKTLTSNLWSVATQLTSDGTWNFDPDVMVAKDGSVLVAFAKWNAAGEGDWNIYYRTYSGTTWTGDVLLASAADWDTTPDFSQDRNHTIWLFWAREMKLTGTIFQDKLWYKFSDNGGSTWSADRQLTFGGTAADPIDDREPSAVQALDKSLWIFYSSDATGDGFDFDIYYSTTPILIHDVEVLTAVASPVSVERGETVRITATVGNLGDYSETVQVDAYYENTTRILFNSTSITLPPGRSSQLQLSWNTTAVPLGDYRMIVSLRPVPGESPLRQNDNSADAGHVVILPPIGDVDRNGRVDILDVAMVAILFGSTLEPEDLNGDCVVDILDLAVVAFSFGTIPGDPNWNSQADMDGNGRVDILDVATVAIVFGSTMGPEDLNGDCVIDILDMAIVAFHYGEGT